MKRVILFVLFSLFVNAFNFDGTWVNRSNPKWGEPKILKIKNKRITPIIRGIDSRVTLATKRGVDNGAHLFGTWRVNNKFLVIDIAPVNSKKIAVLVKKLYCNQRYERARRYIFVKKSNSINYRRFLGNYISKDRYLSPITRLKIIKGNPLLVIGYRNNLLLGEARARVVGNKIVATYHRRGQTIRATIEGRDYNPYTNRYDKLKLTIENFTSYGDLLSKQTIYLYRNHHRRYGDGGKHRHLRVGPIDIDIAVN